MFKHFLVLGLGLILLASWPTASDRTPARAPPEQPGPRTLDSRSQVPDRLPVHEAVARPPLGQPRRSPLVPKPPPALLEELSREYQPQGINMQFIGGYWAWNADSNAFQWTSGLWRDLPPGRLWIPGYWTQEGDGWQRVTGYWAEHA